MCSPNDLLYISRIIEQNEHGKQKKELFSITVGDKGSEVIHDEKSKARPVKSFEEIMKETASVCKENQDVCERQPTWQPKDFEEIEY